MVEKRGETIRIRSGLRELSSNMTEPLRIGSVGGSTCLASVSPVCSRAKNSNHFIQAVEGSDGGQASPELRTSLGKMCSVRPRQELKSRQLPALPQSSDRKREVMDGDRSRGRGEARVYEMVSVVRGRRKSRDGHRVLEILRDVPVAGSRSSCH